MRKINEGNDAPCGRPRTAIPPEQLFDIAADVERYPAFLAWWQSARITQRSGDVYHTDQVVGVGPFSQRFTTMTVLRRPLEIAVTALEGSFRTFTLTLRFGSLEQGRCRVALDGEVELRARLLGKLFDRAIAAERRQTVRRHRVARLCPRVERRRTDQRPATLRLHPNLSEVYRQRVENLHQALDGPDSAGALETVRSLIERAVLHPAPGGERGFEIELIGDIAAMVSLGATDKDPSRGGAADHNVFRSSIRVVAGARNHLCRTRFRIPDRG